MNLLKIIFVAFALISISFISDANPPANNNKHPITKSIPLNYAQQITFDSKILGKSRLMNIYLPENFEQSSVHHTYPVIFISGEHGNKFFHALTGIVKHLSDMERMPKSIVVSLNNGGLTPGFYTNGMWGEGMDTLTGDDKPELYLPHLEQEVFPFLRENYRANNHRTIIGVSANALFSLDTFIRSPETFNAYLFLATSDMIGMGYKKGHTLIESMGESLSKRPDRNEYLYFADDDSGFDHDPAYQQNINMLKDTLSIYKNSNFNFNIETLANENHYAAFLKAMLSAFEHMYPQKLWAPKYREIIKQPGDAMTNIDNFYHALSAKYNFDILPNADRWNNVNNLRFIAGKLLRDGRVEEAISVAERWNLYQPKSLGALLTWAKALEKSSLNKEALKKYQQLILLAKDQQSERLAEFKLAMKKVQNKRK
jgi:predicted alpha/beta superfamily hydrolase